MVSAEDAVTIYQLLTGNEFQVWVLGGWGVDALLEEETRPHKDLDLLVLLDDIARMRDLLSQHGFILKELWSENRWAADVHGNQTATAFVLRDSKGREIDMHAININETGIGVPAWDAPESFFFKQEDLASSGRIADHSVVCISPHMQMACRSGYELPETHRRDLEHLHQRFGTPYPRE